MYSYREFVLSAASHFLMSSEFSKIYSPWIGQTFTETRIKSVTTTYSFFTGRLLSWLASVQCSSDCGGGNEGSVCLCTQNSSPRISISAICSVAAMSEKKNNNSRSMYKSSYWKSEDTITEELMQAKYR